MVGGVPQHRQEGVRFTRHLHFPHDPARVIHNADTRLIDGNVQSSKMVHAALLLLMLEAVTTDLASPSASSAAPKLFSYPQAGRPITPSPMSAIGELSGLIVLTVSFVGHDPERTPRRSVAAGSPSCIPQLSDSRRKWFVVVLSRDR